jgi:hypothetical protein
MCILSVTERKLANIDTGGGLSVEVFGFKKVVD